MTTEQTFRDEAGTLIEVSAQNPFPVTAYFPGLAFGGSPVMADYLWAAAADRRIFIAGDGDQNDTVTGQTSFANTTPTFMLHVPAGTTAIPLFVNLGQTGTVAGGDIELAIEVDYVNRYSSGGTSEKVLSTRRGGTNRSLLYSNPTALAGFGQTIVRLDIGPDVSTAEGAIPGPFWKPEVPYILEGPAAFLIYTSAGTTGPTWFWNIGWMEIPSVEMP